MRPALRVVALVATFVAWPTLSAYAALDDEAVRQRTAEVLSDPEYQTEAKDNAQRPEEPKPERERPRYTRHDSSDPSPVQAPSDVSQALIWIVLGAFAAAIVAMLVSQLMRSARQRKLKPQRHAPATALELELALGDPERLDETLRRALRLASEGRFEEAVHALLAGAIHDLQERAGLATEPALTSRELLERAPLRSDPRVAFHDLVQSVEVSLFGGLSVTRGDFDRCATSFRTLRQAVVA